MTKRGVSGLEQIRVPVGRKRKNLVIVAAGDKSVHRSWPQDLTDAQRSWDLLITQWGDQPHEDAEADIVVRQKGYKYDSTWRLFQAIPWLAEYDYVWLCDDDIATSWSDIQHMFALAEDYRLDLAQPALTRDSYATHAICYALPDNLLRYTNFVEVMIPVFSQAALKTCLPSFAAHPTGSGTDLDWIWPKLLGHPTNRFAILDAVAMHHTRPLGTSEMWQHIHHDHPDLQQKLAALLKIFDIDPKTCNKYQEYGYILKKPANSLNRTMGQWQMSGQQLDRRLVPLLSAATHNKISPDWHRNGLVWQHTAPWQGGEQNVYAIPQLPKNNWCMSLALTLNVSDKTPPPNGNGVRSRSLECLTIGSSANRPCLCLALYEIREGGYTLTLNLPDKGYHGSIQTLPCLPLNQDIRLCLQIYPVAGWTRLWINNQPMKDFWFLPQLSEAANMIRFGDPLLQGSIRDFLLSPIPADETEDESLTGAEA